MTSSVELRLRRARKAAAALTERYGVMSAADVRLEDIAWDLGVQIAYGGLSGASARLVRAGNRAIIRVNDAVGYEPRQRFSIAHELGHHQLEHVGTEWKGCLERDLDDYVNKPVEAEANAFASELLMPKQLIRRACEACPVNLSPIRDLAERFRTSLTAAAIRFVQLSPEMCAVVLSRGNKVEWSFKSESMWPYLRGRGTQLSTESLAFDFFTSGKEWPAAQHVSGDAWFEGKAAETCEEVVEHTLGMRSLGQALTILWLES